MESTEEEILRLQGLVDMLNKFLKTMTDNSIRMEFLNERINLNKRIRALKRKSVLTL